MDGRSMTWTKRLPDGSLVTATAIYARDWSLTSPTDSPRDGWEWHESIDEAAAAMPWIEGLTPTQAEAVVSLGLGLVMQAGPMWDALGKMSPTNTARPVLDVIVTVALEAGLQLLEAEKEATP